MQKHAWYWIVTRMLERLVIYYAQLSGTLTVRSSIPDVWLIKAVFKNFARNMMTVFHRHHHLSLRHQPESQLYRSFSLPASR